MPVGGEGERRGKIYHIWKGLRWQDEVRGPKAGGGGGK